VEKALTANGTDLEGRNIRVALVDREVKPRKSKQELIVPE
jgi:hypothetical protein